MNYGHPKITLNFGYPLIDLDILNSEYLWISINRIMDIHKSFLNAILLFIPYLWISINHFWISKNRAELRISIIHFRISINRFMDIPLFILFKDIQ